jgi:hypothetical protein
MSLRQEDREDRISRRAYHLWETAGLRESDELACWLKAEDLEAAEESRHHGQFGESFPSTDPQSLADAPAPSEK